MKKKQILLADIAEIQTGYVFRGRLTEDPDGNVQVIQNKNLADGKVDLSGLSTVSIPARGNQWRVRRGDILLRTRGNDIGVAVVEQEPQQETIAASPLMLIRVKDAEQTDPAFLAWLLAQPAAQAHLNFFAQGTSVRVINKAAAESIPLSLPDKARQQLMAEINSLSAEIRRLTHELADREAAYINTLLTRYDHARS